MKKVLLSVAAAVLIAVQVVCFTACGGFNPPPMYDKTFTYTGKAMPIYWEEMHGITFNDEEDMKMSRREVLEKYFDRVDWDATKEAFGQEMDRPAIQLTDAATKSVDAFIAFMDEATEDLYTAVKGMQFRIGSEADAVDVTITYPNGQTQTVSMVNGGVQDPAEFRGIQFTKEGENGTEISLGLSRTGNANVAFNADLYDSFTQEQLGMYVRTVFYFTLLDENDDQLMDIDVYAAYTETANA